MQAEILTVGDEIVSGYVVDTNAAYLATRIGELGIGVRRISSVGDDVAAICDEIRSALEGADLVFVTGGLGPTEDDVTKQAVARAVGRKLVVDREIHTRLAERGEGKRPVSPQAAEALALIPEGATTIGNPVGAAVGLDLQHEGRRLFVLPGVPREMKSIFEGAIVRLLKDMPKEEVAGTRVVKTTGIRESEITARLAAVAENLPIRLGYLPRPEGVDLRLTAQGADPGTVAAKLDEALAKILPLLGAYAYSAAGEELNLVVGNALKEQGVTLAVAESCTGGLIGHLLTQVAGISACLDRVIVSYSNRAKVESLGVSQDLIEKHGAVSREVAGAMADCVKRLAGSDLGLSTTGIAGPSGATKTKHVGLVYIGFAHAQGSVVSERVFQGNREIVKLKAATHALDMVRMHLADGEG
jgi:nicotinamide-nucleotide amidase